MKIILNKLVGAIGLVVSVVSQAQAATFIELKSVDAGFYNGATGSHDPLNNSVSIQQDSTYSDRNFFVFDFSGLDTTSLISVELYAINAWNFSTENHIDYSLYDVTSTIQDLEHGFNGKSTYDDLGSGVSFGNLNISNPSRYDSFNIVFNQAGLNAAKETSGYFAIGGAFTSKTTGVSFFLANNENPIAPLSYGLRLGFSEAVSAVPESDSYAMLLIGLSVISYVHRRRNVRTEKC